MCWGRSEGLGCLGGYLLDLCSGNGEFRPAITGGGSTNPLPRPQLEWRSLTLRSPSWVRASALCDEQGRLVSRRPVRGDGPGNLRQRARKIQTRRTERLQMKHGRGQHAATRQAERILRRLRMHEDGRKSWIVAGNETARCEL
jgi:hypothetical protein